LAPAHLETAHPLLDDHTPDELEAVPEIEVMTRASFPPSVRDPDIVVVPARVFERRPTRATAADVVLVVEIVSPGSRGTDHVMKLHEYAKAGIANYWIVDSDAPADEQFLAYRLPKRIDGSRRSKGTGFA